MPKFMQCNGHGAIKVHVNKVQYCRAGPYYFSLKLCLMFKSNMSDMRPQSDMSECLTTFHIEWDR